MSRNLRALHDERGQMLVLSAAVIVALLAFTGLVVDIGFLYAEHRQAQNAADQAAKAAAYEMTYGGSTAAAIQAGLETSLSNGFDNNGGTSTVTVNIPPASGEHVGDPNYVEVIVYREPTTFFIHVVLEEASGVTARAVAGFTVTPGGPISDASIIALNSSQCTALDFNANDAVRVDGAIMLNSDCNQYAGVIGANADFRALGGILSVGGVSTDENCSVCNVTTIPHFTDPLAAVLPPCFANAPTPCENVDDLGNPGSLTVRNGTPGNPQQMTNSGFDFQPGIYYGGISVSPSNPVTFAPGVYVMAGGGFKVNSNSSFTAQGVFIYNTNDPSCPGCSEGGFKEVIINSNASAHFSPMTSGPYAGLLFFQDRANAEKAVFNPNASFGEGTVYFPSALVDLNPNANATLQIIADTIVINSNASFRAEFDGDSFYQGPGASSVSLVE